MLPGKMIHYFDCFTTISLAEEYPVPGISHHGSKMCNCPKNFSLIPRVILPFQRKWNQVLREKKEIDGKCHFNKQISLTISWFEVA